MTLLLLLLMSPSLAAAPPHPLLDTLWEGASRQPLVQAHLQQRVLESRWILLGEVHGNPVHHARQLEVLQWLRASGQTPTVAFEIFDQTDQAAMTQFIETGSGDAAALGQQLDMEARGWPFASYQPLVQYALDEGLPILAVNLSRAQAQRVAREGPDGLESVPVRQLLQQHPLATEVQEALYAHIFAAHCEYLPKAHVPAVALAQQARDATIAWFLQQASSSGPVVLISGAGHVRKDYGVPFYLQALDPEHAPLSVGFIEIHSERSTLEAYLHGPEGAPYDVLWFSARTSPEDPCVAFREQLEQMRGE
ncbi:ChaN family lipoprotein [Thiorhodospira sibirica]|uniref:ChaN family lipoprotein n=1 Tax=Thiorhodospira sibirica TaxID=154347 RepID=UPI00030C0526|nr:ChaN family lipoprotein [Thiorhodospira sibirica]